jgi:p-hydroxybenzoate 3-monooxygenase
VVWKGQRFSRWNDDAAGPLPGQHSYYDKPQETDMSYLFSSEAALRSLAENYVGLPFKSRSGLRRI